MAKKVIHTKRVLFTISAIGFGIVADGRSGGAVREKIPFEQRLERWKSDPLPNPLLPRDNLKVQIKDF